MKSTGVIRKIDELGRIVLPKEIRRNLGIRDGENLEIFVDDDKILLKKYSKISDYSEIITNIGQIFSDTTNFNVLITDRDKIVYSSFDKNIIGKEIDENLLKLIHNRESISQSTLHTYKFNDVNLEGYFLISSIISSIDCLGLVIIYSDKNISDESFKTLKLVSNLIASKLDIS